MSVSNGQIANAATFNNAFLSRLTDSSTVARIDLNSPLAASGASLSNIQREMNKLNSFLGSTPNTAFDALPAWTNNDVGASTDPVKTRADLLTAAFNAAAGHNHDGTTGSGGPISGTDLIDMNLFFAEFQTTTFTGAGGTSDDVSASFSGKVSGGGVSTVGVPTTAPNNRCEIRDLDTGDQLEDTDGQKVYARITEAAGVWTLTYYTSEAGVETAHSLTANDIRIYFKEVFDQDTRPTFPSDVGDIGSLDMTADVVDASATARGLVSVSTQSFSGAKTFTGDLIGTAKFRGDVATDAATTGANATLPAPSKLHLRVSNASLTSIDMISGPAATQFFILTNKTGASVLVNNETGATAGNRILTGTGATLTLENDASLWFMYDSTSTRWIIVGGSGSGGTDVRSGTDTIGSGVATKVVTFSSALASTNYSIVATIQNTTDASPQFHSMTVTAKATTGFTVKWNNNTDSANYSLEWVATLHN